MKELISVVIPIYNVEKYLRRCIDSVIKQTYENLEIILVDDGSQDNCAEICDEYAINDSRIKVIHKLNGGLSDARNSGIDIASGKYITFIDSDDYVTKDYIEVLYNALKADMTDLAISSHKVIYENGTVIEKATGEKSILSSKEVLERILYDDGIDLSAWAKLYKIELWNDVRYPKGRLFEDSATTYKLIDKCDKVTIISKATYNYMIRNSSITNVKFSNKKLDLIKSTQEMCTYVKKRYPDLEKATNRRLMYAYLSTLTQLIKSNEKNDEVEEYLYSYIEENSKKVLIDKKVPTRDKLALISTKFGLKFYKIIWKIYEKITGRR